MTTATKPTPLRPQWDGIPAALRDAPSWVLWRYEWRKDKKGAGKWTKPPHRAVGRGYAKTDDPGTWSDFHAARQAADSADGVGIVLTEDMVGVDLDHVIDDQGEIQPWAAEIIERFRGCYVERSPGGDGVRIFCRGVARHSGKGGPENRCEVYDKSSPRYLTVTGCKLVDGEVIEAQAALDWLHVTHMQKPAQKATEAPAGAHSAVGDDEVLRMAAKARNGPKFSRLFAGDGGDDPSTADAALIGILSFWTQDPAQLDRLFRRSGLMRPKWDEQRGEQTYGERTIAAVLGMGGERFKPGDGVTRVTGVQANDDAGLRVTPGVTPGCNGVTDSPIPGESERPCYRVFDEWTEAGESKLRPGVWSFGIRHGKGDAPPALTQAWICSPVHVDAVTTDAHGGNFGRQLRFSTTLGKWRTFAMPMELLRGDGADLRGELLAMGVEIDPSQRNALAMYLQHRPPKRRILCALQVGWANPGAFVLPDEVIGPNAVGVAFQSSERAADEYGRAGTLESWQAEVAAPAAGNPLLALALCSAFAGPLLLRCGAESGGIHLVGDSSTGKTTAVEVACSVWGGPGFARTWRATANGLEGVASLMNDTLLALDEISQCDPREVGAIVYQLGNGQGKQRASRTGSARPVLRWRCSVLSSGERTIGTTMAEGGHRVKAGQTVRLLDVPTQRKHGAWDELHGSATGAAFSDRLKAAARQHYGHAGRAFLQRLTRDTETDLSAALEAIKAMLNMSTDLDGPTPGIDRVA